MYELIIIGGGPAGAASAVYAARKKVKTLIITKDFGGQSVVSDDIGNWIGDINVSGTDLAKRFEDHVRAQEDIDIHTDEFVESIEMTKDGDYPEYKVKTTKGEYDTYAIMVTSGGRRRKLNVPGESDFEGRGVVYCSTCDAPLFRDKEVAVVGTGNAGLEACIDLFPYAKKIYLLNRGDKITGDATSAEIVLNHEKVELLNHTEVKEIKGEVLMNKAILKSNEDDSERELDLQGLFIEIGSIPNSEIVEGLVDLNERKEIIVDLMKFETSARGIYAAGDVTHQVYKQNNISAGNAVSATLAVYEYITKLRKEKGIH